MAACGGSSSTNPVNVTVTPATASYAEATQATHGPRLQLSNNSLSHG